jgi:hypothetical protein
MNFKGASSARSNESRSNEPIRWWNWPQILNIGGPHPSFNELSMCAPIDMNVNRQLYCFIFLMNLFIDVLPLKDAKDANGSGQGL